MKKLIKNYTTDIPAERTIAEIQTILAQNGARGIALEYDERGDVSADRLHGFEQVNLQNLIPLLTYGA
jgi:hypothetical protein